LAPSRSGAASGSLRAWCGCARCVMSRGAHARMHASTRMRQAVALHLMVAINGGLCARMHSVCPPRQRTWQHLHHQPVGAVGFGEHVQQGPTHPGAQLRAAGGRPAHAPGSICAASPLRLSNSVSVSSEAWKSSTAA